VDEFAAYLDFRATEKAGADDSGMLGCWCYQNTKAFDLAALLSTTFEAAQKEL